MALKLPAAEAANVAIQSIGCGYDLSLDLRLKYRKRRNLSDFGNNPYRNCRLIEIDEDEGRDIVLPGGLLILNVPQSIKSYEGESKRVQSDILSFTQMSEQFNNEVSVNGKIPSGLFNAMFELSGNWKEDESSTKTLAFDGVVISLYTVALEKSQMVLRDDVKNAIPSTWQPALLARFILKFGTHIVVGVKMGGKDVIYMKQHHASSLEPTDVQKMLNAMADKRFLDTEDSEHISDQNEEYDIKEQRLRFADSDPSSSYSYTEDLVSLCRRRGGSDDKNLKHKEWLHTVQLEPDVISMSFIPIASLLTGVSGSGFLVHAINLYLRYKVPIKELHQFLEYQLQREWSPFLGDELLSRASLQFSFFGPKLYVNTNSVNVGKRLVTGIQLNNDGLRRDCLAIYLQYLSDLPKIFQLEDSVTGNFDSNSDDHKYYKKVQSQLFSLVCTAPVESEDKFSIVTGAQLQVRDRGSRKVLFLRLHFSKLLGCTFNRNPEWDGSSSQKPQSQPPPVVSYINLGIYIGPLPDPDHKTTLLKYVDTTKMTRGPQEALGYWVVSGARLIVDKGKISLGVKYSLPVMLTDEEVVKI